MSSWTPSSYHSCILKGRGNGTLRGELSLFLLHTSSFGLIPFFFPNPGVGLEPTTFQEVWGWPKGYRFLYRFMPRPDLWQQLLLFK